LIVDASESMRVQTGAVSKYTLAVRAAAALGFLILQQTDAVGLATFADGVRHFLRPSARGGNHYRELLRLLVDGPADTPGAIKPVLDELAGRLGRRGIVFLISDFLDDVPELLAGLRHLLYQKHEVILIHTLDAAELDFPFNHPTLFRGLEGLPELNTDPGSVRDNYLAALGEHLTALETGCRGLEIDYLRLRTDGDLGVDLGTYLRRRQG
jgi:uncharacterized protein (DUF58 family)